MKLELVEWWRLWHAVGAQGDAELQFLKLSERYSEPARHYHTGEHIAECLREFRNVEQTISDSKDTEMALWLHDVIYDPKSPDNEEQSAKFATEIFREAHLSNDFAARVRQLILATRHNVIPSEASARMMVDIDLSILGQDPKRFWRYEDDIRKEYAFVPDRLFRTKRAEILEAFLRRERIYQTEFFASRYEQLARENLNESVRRLRD
jgi:predicted metal-dependent HD superfamily phosphohydrolase